MDIYMMILDWCILLTDQYILIRIVDGKLSFGTG
jgi:hypothetical protein